MAADGLSAQERARRRVRFASHNIGLLAGTPLSTGRTFGFINVDDDRYVAFFNAVLTPFVSAKVGAKGLTIFCQVEPGIKSKKLKVKGAKAPTAEIFATSGMTVVPRSVHPSGRPYEWRGKSLLEIRHDELPILTGVKLAVIEAVLRNKHAVAIVEGGATVKAHDLMLLLASSGCANLTDDLEWLADCLNALFHPEYAGDTKAETLGMLETAKKKGLGFSSGSVRNYDPGDEGPIPLGFTKDGNFALRDQVRSIIVVASASQLLSMQYLLGLASSGSGPASTQAISHFSMPMAPVRHSCACAVSAAPSTR